MHETGTNPQGYAAPPQAATTPAFATELIALLPRLRRYTMTLTRSTSESEDLAQAACERALRAQAQWQEGTRLDAWLFSIARNLWIDQLRKRRREGASEALDLHPELQGEDGRQVTESALTAGSVQQALEEMPSEQRDLLLLVCVDGLSYRDASDRLSIPIGTVMSRLSRARLGLARRLGMEPR